MKKLFIGGLPSSGTTVTKDLLIKLLGSKGTWEYAEGHRDPQYPFCFPQLALRARAIRLMNNRLESFPDIKNYDLPFDKEIIEKWVNKFCIGEGDDYWFVEKTPMNWALFEAWQDLYPNDAYFIFVQRHPYQRLYSARRRWATNLKTKRRFKESEWNWTSGDDFRTKPLIDFWQNDLKKIKNLKIIRYEDLCKHPVQTCKEVLKFLSIKKYDGFIEKVVSEVGVSIRHEYKVNKEFNEPSCKELAEIWNYKT